ncbi:MAG: hypothetical protein HY907_06150 [Deltaproteobacteria bacterium]|nr:hypothetical protein [Deltaproteobacteria bacterium]
MANSETRRKRTARTAAPGSGAGHTHPRATARHLPPAQRNRLGPTLAAILDAELRRGNAVVSAACWTAHSHFTVTLEKPLDYARHAPVLEGHPEIVRFESWDPHYAIQDGLRDPAHDSFLVGSPPVIDELRPLLQDLVAKIVAGRTAALARAGVLPATLQRELARCARRGFPLVLPPQRAYGLDGPGSSLAGSRLPDRRAPTWRIQFRLWDANPAPDSQPTPFVIGLEATRRPTGDLKMRLVEVDDLRAGRRQALQEQHMKRTTPTPRAPSTAGPAGVVESFIREMNRWERRCWRSGRADAAALAGIFDACCLPGDHHRLTFSIYGYPPTYDPRKEKVLGVEQAERSAVVRTDGSWRPKTVEFRYELARRDSEWRIRRKKATFDDGSGRLEDL